MEGERHAEGAAERGSAGPQSSIADFRRFGDALPLSLWVSGRDKETIYVNQPWLDYTGRSEDLELRYGWSESLHPADAEGALAEYAAAFGARRRFRIECRLRRFDCEYRWFLALGAPFYSPGGDFLGYVGTAIDVHERHALESSLRASENRFRALHDDNPCMFFTVDAGGAILSVSRFCAEQLGYASEELVGLSVSTVVHPQDRARARELLADAFEHPARLSQWELRKVRQNGSEVWVRETVRIVADADRQRLALVVCEDVTRHHELESQLRQVHKMEAVGRLAGTIAHDFNNVLTVISGYSEMLQAAAIHAELRTPLQEIARATGHATTLTRRLLDFSRKHALESRPLDPNEVLRALGPMLQRLLGANVELRLELAPESALVLADPAQIDQIVLNLALNARDAMPEGGELVVATRQVELDESEADRFGLPAAGSYVCLEVRDTGSGMDAETQAHIFEPFFTTKEGRGTGLGLSSVYGIARQTGGGVTVASEPGRGARFSVFLPRMKHGRVPDQRLVEESAEGEEASFALARGHGTVLLVEDERGVRDLLVAALRGWGYEVLVAGSAVEAERVLDGHSGAVDLLLTDLILPGASGHELAGRLRALRPGLKVVCMSGYPCDALGPEQQTVKDFTLVPKPFTLAQLTRVLARSLTRDEA